MSKTDATFAQATHSLVILDQQGLEAEHYRVLHGGYLADLAQAVFEKTVPSRDEFRKSLEGMSPEERKEAIRKRLESMTPEQREAWKKQRAERGGAAPQ